jgi:hypothetical protein
MSGKVGNPAGQMKPTSKTELAIMQVNRSRQDAACDAWVLTALLAIATQHVMM